MHWDKTQMLKKFPSDKIKVTKKYFFLLRAPAHHSFLLTHNSLQAEVQGSYF